MVSNMISDTAGIVTDPVDKYKESKEPNLQPSSTGLVAKTGMQTSGFIAAASAKSLRNVIRRPYKSIFVDVPLAVADCLNAVLKLYGSEVRERDKVTGFKSGSLVAGKSFVYDIAGGLADLVVEPYKGGKKEGALGVAKGVGKGSLGFLVKTGSGT